MRANANRAALKRLIVITICLNHWCKIAHVSKRQIKYSNILLFFGIFNFIHIGLSFIQAYLYKFHFEEMRLHLLIHFNN